MFMGAFAGTHPTVVQLSDAGFFDSAISPSVADQIVALNSSGWVQDNGVDTQQWLLIGANSDYEVFVHNNGPDALLSGTLDTWLSLGTTRTWRLQRTGLGTNQAVLAVQIREVSSGVVRATANFTLTVIVDI